MTYYLKYRSKTIDELDQKQVRESLVKMVSSGNIPHAFLLSGPKGIGKTSAARILAKVVNCESVSSKLRGPGKFEPCNQCDQCISITKGSNIDVIELDAASHRGIDDVRTLRDAVKLAPAKAKKKVYIIDEAHMLTTEASNALLKTLEEPPDHVIFILATTNPEKLIETIRSRTVNISFTKAKFEEIIRSLRRVAEGEKLKAGEEVFRIIAQASDGSFRDAVKLLEELVVGNIKLERETVDDYLSNKKTFDAEKFVKILKDNSEKEAYREIEKAVGKGASMKQITALILERLRIFLLAKVGISGDDEGSFTKTELLDLIGLISRSYSEVGYAVLEQIPLELAVSEWFSKRSVGDNSKPDPEEKREAIKDKKKVSGKDLSESEVSLDENKSNGKTEDSSQAGMTQLNGFGNEEWSKILSEIRPKNASTEALLRAAKPIEYDGKTLTLGVYYKFHKERLETNSHRSLLESVIQNITGDNIRVICTLTDPPLKPVNRNVSETQSSSGETVVLVESETVLAEGQDEEIINAAKEIFGG